MLDPLQVLGPEQLSQQDFQVFQGDLNLGYRSGAVWIRIRVQADAAPQDQAGPSEAGLILRVGPHQLEDLELFLPSKNTWSTQRSGARQPSRAGPCVDDLHCFVLPQSVETFYLKLVTPTFIKASFNLASVEETTQQVAINMGKNISAYSLSITLFAVGLIFYLIDRSAVLLAYLCLQSQVIFSLVTATGALGAWVPSLTPDQWIDLSYVFIIGRSLAFVVLTHLAIARYLPTTLYGLGSWGLMATLALAGVFLMFGQVTTALQINLAVTLLNPVLQIYGMVTAKGIPPNFRKFFLVAYSSYALLVLLAGINIFVAPIQFPEIQFLPNISNGIYSGTFIGLLVFWLALAENSRQRFVRMQEAQELRVQIAAAQADEKALKERGALIDMLTHELKNPLGTMRFALASFREPLGPSSAARVRRMEQSIQRMDTMIEMVALSTKLEQHQVTSGQNIDVEEFVRILAEGFPDPERFALQIEPGIRCVADRQLLTVALENLMSNAYKYGGADPLHIEVRRQDEHGQSVLRFLVSNSVAPGCEPDQARLFARYYRHPRTSEQPGMGLGLSLVRVAAEKMGAQVHYRFSGGWASFEVRLPC